VLASRHQSRLSEAGPDLKIPGAVPVLAAISGWAPAAFEQWPGFFGPQLFFVGIIAYSRTFPWLSRLMMQAEEPIPTPAPGNIIPA